MIEIDLPSGWSNPRIVIGYNGEIRLMVSMEDRTIVGGNEADIELLKQKKIEYLEKAIGYPIVKLEDLVKHDDYEKMWEKEIEEMKKRSNK